MLVGLVIDEDAHDGESSSHAMMPTISPLLGPMWPPPLCGKAGMAGSRQSANAMEVRGREGIVIVSSQGKQA
jgi:hypothetical protein